jgi:DNA-binding HxlR family transcriptional regulator
MIEISRTRPHPIPASSVARALNAIGDRWTLLILRDAFLGVRRFEQWQQHLRIARQLLAERLRRLVAHGLLSRLPYQAHPPRHDYRLTEMGRDLYPLALMIRQWERCWGSGVDAKVGEVILLHRSCGSRTEPRCVCAKCGEKLDAHQIEVGIRSVTGETSYLWPRRQRRSSAIPSRDRQPFLHDAIDILGDRWTYLLLITIFYGIRRYGELNQALGISTNVLSDRLMRLMRAQILQHVTANERRNSHEYVLTEKGFDLFPVIVSLLQWGDRWLPGSRGPRGIIRHQLCGSRLKTRIVCDSCSETLCSLDVDYRWPETRRPSMRKYLQRARFMTKTLRLRPRVPTQR